MTAIEFIKKFGWDVTKRIVENKPKWADNVRVNTNPYTWEYTESVLPSFSVLDIKQYVDAWELVQSYGGVDGARKVAHKDPFDYHNQYELLKAIALVEQVNATN